MEMTRDQILEAARKIRAFISESAVNVDDERAVEIPFAFDAWTPGTAYATGDRVRYGGKVYKCLQDHEALTEWFPTAAASLWAQVLTATEGDEIPEWVQPDSTSGYNVGDKVLYDGVVYVSLVDNNVWSPAAYPTAWRADA